MVFHADEQPPLACCGRNLERLGVLQDKRLHAQHVLIGLEGRHDHSVVPLVGHCHDNELPRRHALDHARVQVGIRLGDGPAESRIRGEGLPGECGQDLGIRSEGAKRR